jgi:Transposase DDE domain group 1
VVPNDTWFQLVLFAADLVAWTKVLCLYGDLQRAEPKRLRYAFLHVAARVIHSARRVTLRIQNNWPRENELVNAFVRLRTIALR